MQKNLNVVEITLIVVELSELETKVAKPTTKADELDQLLEYDARVRFTEKVTHSLEVLLSLSLEVLHTHVY